MTDGTIKDYRYFLKDSIRKEIDFQLTDQSRGITPPDIQKPPATGKEIIDLPPTKDLLNEFCIPLAKAMDQRQSVRQFSDRPLSLKELSFLLWATQGVRTVMGNTVSLRTVPSAGGRHSFETYLYVRNIETIGGWGEGGDGAGDVAKGGGVETEGDPGKVITSTGNGEGGESVENREGKENMGNGEGEESEGNMVKDAANNGAHLKRGEKEKSEGRKERVDREKLPEGIYRYLPLTHQLVQEFHEEGLGMKLTSACFGQRFVGEGAVTFLWSTIPYRMEWRYGLAAHRVIALDAGHVCQNLYLACEAIGAGTCAIGAYDQEKVDALLGLDGEEEFVLYLAPVGKKR